MKGQFIEDMEEIYETYKRKFVYYSAEYNFLGKEKAKQKMQDYKKCVDKMSAVMKFIDTL